MLLAAAELVGLTVLNAKKVKPELFQQYRPEAAREWAALKERTAKREQFEHEDTEPETPEQPVNEDSPEDGGKPAPETVAPAVADALNDAAKEEETPVAPKKELLDFNSLPPERQQQAKDFFRRENKAESAMTDDEIAKRWNNWPLPSA